ncbi:response regulator [Paenibacillus chartarius]|uniref:Response regulator n=1 Tax=Paenibacillus chartarius TaxID=747481 RepID=A0ABV6DH40_9BACL
MAKILIVDDSNLMRRNLKILLERAGHQVVGEAADGLEAYRQYVVTQPDIVTMDITMPNMNGIEAVQKILAGYPEACIMIISAIDQKSMVLEAIKLGAKHYIIKPVTEQKIVQTVEQLLASQTADSEAGQEAEANSERAADEHEGPLPAFSMENRDGWIILTFRGGIEEQALEQARLSVQGLLFMKPLKVGFHFVDISSLSPSQISVFGGLAAAIEQAEGSAKAICADQSLYRKLSEQAIFSTVQAE